MAWYAIGDVQGCYLSLQKLLTEFDFDPAHDQLWFTGDLVNRGPDSLEVLRWVRSLGASATTVLGNHDLHLLAYAEGQSLKRRGDTLDQILQAPDAEMLLDWLRHRPLLVERNETVLLHAGLAPGWTLDEAKILASEVETCLQSGGPNYQELLHTMYGNEPDRWTDNLQGPDRYRVIINAFTRLRFCARDGRFGLRFKGPPGSQPKTYRPWYTYHQQSRVRFVFGHWSTHGDNLQDNALCLDHGCVWGGRLSAVRLDVDPPRWYSVSCRSPRQR